MLFLAESISVFVAIIGVIFVLAGVLGIVKDIRKYSKCNEQVVAKLKGYNEDLGHTSHGTQSITYVPVFEYQYNGFNYVKEYRGIQTAHKKYKVDEEVEIKLNPNKPEEFVIGKPLKDVLFMSMFAILGGVCLYLYFTNK